MTDAVQAARDHFVGQTYQDIALADGDDLPAVLQQRRNPRHTHQTLDQYLGD
jgi:hypothetical protein